MAVSQPEDFDVEVDADQQQVPVLDDEPSRDADNEETGRDDVEPEQPINEENDAAQLVFQHACDAHIQGGLKNWHHFCTP